MCHAIKDLEKKKEWTISDGRKFYVNEFLRVDPILGLLLLQRNAS